MPSSNRHRVELPAALGRALNATAQDRGVTVANVAYMIVIRAAAAAAAGHGDALPQLDAGRRAPRGSLGEIIELRWTQGPAEYNDCVRQIEAAGSTLAAAVRAGVEAYIAAGGDAVRMVWPIFRSARAAA